MNEVWRGIPGYEGYLFSNLGRVKSLNYHRTGTEKIMTLEKTKNGYLRVKINNKHILIHRLIWEAFIGPIPEGMQINHINEDKTDNRLENLELVTPEENLNFGSRSRKAVLAKSKPICQYTISGVFIKEWESAQTIQNEKGYWHSSIGAVCRGERETAYGYKWAFK